MEEPKANVSSYKFEGCFELVGFAEHAEEGRQEFGHQHNMESVASFDGARL